MKKILKLTQGIMGAHLSSVFLSFMFMLLFGVLTDKIGITKYFLLLIWFGGIYSVGWHKGRKDARNIKGVYPDVKSNTIAALLFSSITLIMLVVRISAFHIAAGGQIGNEPQVLVIADIVYRLWSFPFIDFMQNGTLISYTVPVIFPFAVYVGSYFIGLKKFSIFEKILPKVIYKKKFD